MSRDDDRPSWTEREKKSFSELDKERREGRRADRAPQGKGARARSAAATKQQLKEADALFSVGKGGALGERLASAIREAHGTPGLADACRAYRDGVGVPDDASLLSLFLDSGDPELVVAALEGLLALHERGGGAIGSGLASQIRMLAQDSDDAVAQAAEDLVDVM